MIGYTISSLDSNESILEKLIKLEKYLRDHPFINLLITDSTISTNIINKSDIINISNIDVGVDDLILDATGKVYAVVDVEDTTIEIDYAHPVSFPKGDKGDTGDTGAPGIGISSIDKTATAGNVDIYTITYTNGTTSSFYVTNGINGTNGTNGTNGVGISSIDKTATAGLVDTYTITYTDSSTSTFTVTNGADGVGIVSIDKTATVDLVDTYTITYTDGTTSTFTVTNGQGGGTTTVYVDDVVTSSITSSISSHPVSSTTLGTNSIELGSGAQASGNFSNVIGYNSYSTAIANNVFGISNKANNTRSIIVGNYNETNANDGIIIGESVKTYGTYNIGIGKNITDLSSNDSIAIGRLTRSGGEHSIAIGYGAKAKTSYTIAIGNSEISTTGRGSIMIGEGGYCSGQYSVGFGSAAFGTDYTFQYRDIPFVYENILQPNRPNLLINGDFKINQRGQDTYTNSGTDIYTYDRWKLTGNGSSVDTTTGAITLAGSGTLSQTIEDYKALQGKTVSLIADLNINGLSIGIVDGTTSYSVTSSTDPVYIYNKTISNSATYLTITINNDGASPITFTPSYIKLEEGKSVTMFTHPLIAEELPKCQRYYQLFSSSATLPSSAVDFRPTMRVTPTTGTTTINGTTYQYADAEL